MPETPTPDLPKRTAKELAEALRARALLLTGEKWECEATKAMMYEAADLLLQALLDSHGRETEVRHILWTNHGCPFSALYGDDGEMQCNDLSCRLDFKREPLPALLVKLFAAGRLHTGKLADPAHGRRDVRELHIALNVEIHRLVGKSPACDGPDCPVCAMLDAYLADPAHGRERDESRALTHFHHCYQNEYLTSCKYGDEDCPVGQTGLAKLASEVERMAETERAMVGCADSWMRRAEKAEAQLADYPQGRGQDEIQPLLDDHSVALEFVREVASQPCHCDTGNDCLQCRAKAWLHTPADAVLLSSQHEERKNDE